MARIKHHAIQVPPNASTTNVKLPPLPYLRIRRPNAYEQSPCHTIMSAVLSCWASSGYGIQGCANIEQQLRTCMDAPKPPKQRKNTINYHLARLYPQMIGPHKRK